MVTKKAQTTYWRLQFWKGKYGPPYIPAVANGCEIGLYYRNNKKSAHWYCAYPQDRRIRMKMSLYANGKRLFERDSDTSTAQGKAWWLTAFTPKKYLPKKKVWGKTSLRMKGTLWFPKKGKYVKGMKSLSKKLKKVKALHVTGSVYKRHFDWKGR